MRRWVPNSVPTPSDSADPARGLAFRTHVEPELEVLMLVDVDRLTYAEAADALGVPVGTVMSRLSRARNRVRIQLRHTATVQGRTR